MIVDLETALYSKHKVYTIAHTGIMAQMVTMDQ